jgi:hypothetical protein
MGNDDDDDYNECATLTICIIPSANIVMYIPYKGFTPQN